MLVVRGLPPWAWLMSIGFNSMVTGVVIAQGVHAPAVFNDEATYAQLARRLADGHLQGWVDVLRSGYSITYPLLIAPVFAATNGLPASYAAAKVVNAAVFATAVAPSYLLARRILPQRWALGVAAATIFGPQVIYSTLIMTENVFLPIFLWTCLAAVRMIELPTARRQSTAVGMILLAVVTRLQAVALVPGLVIAVTVAITCGRGGTVRDRLRPYVPAILVFALMPSLFVALQALRGRSITSLLGAYRVLAGGYSPWETIKWTVLNLADFDLLLGVVFFAVVPIAVRLALRGRDARPETRAIAAVFVGFGSTMLLMVGAFSGTSPGGHRVHDRYLFYLVPLALMVGLWAIRTGGVRGRGLVLGAGLAGVLPALLPYGHVKEQAAVDSLALLPWQNQVIDDHFAPVIIPLALVVAGGLVLLRRSVAAYGIATLAVVLFFGFTSARAHSRWNGRYDTGSAGANWIDAAVGPSAHVAGIHVEVPCRYVSRERRWYSLWRAAFFNRSVKLAYFVGHPLPLDKVSSRLVISPAGRATSNGRALTPTYVLVERGVSVKGEVVAREKVQGLALVRVQAPLRITVPPRKEFLAVTCFSPRKEHSQATGARSQSLRG
ncbi:MAG: hypothetical protein ACJ76I_06640 [Gaiellaceae bacterium]